jgi:hypothetical protein
MPQNYQAGEFNSFVGGLVTEASPLTFPENASIDEVNFVLDRNGSRRRRLGINLEPGTTAVPRPDIAPTATEYTTTYGWKNPGGLGGKSLIVLQTDNNITFIDRSAASSDDWRFQAFELVPDNQAPKEILASYAPIDGRLVVAYGGQEVAVFNYDTVSGTITKGDTTKIKIRDLFGVAAILNNKEMWLPENATHRPTPEISGQWQTPGSRNTMNHVYNLRNQGWMQPRARWWGSHNIYHSPSKVWLTQADPISDFLKPNDVSYGRIPSMSDTVVSNLYPRTEGVDVEYKDIQRFDADNCRTSVSKTNPSPKGSFIIDLFNRGVSRQSIYNDTVSDLKKSQGENEPDIPYYITTYVIPSIDRTEGGIKTVAEFAGRVWYGGFDGPLEGGDQLSPNLSSYVTYSQQVKDFTDIGSCYQQADPTNPDDPERVATDGGFIRISGCSNIKAMVNLGSKLIVLSESGIWAIGGTSNGQFDANNQEITKISEYGVLSPRSVVLVEGTLAYWSEDGIYQVLSDEIGNLKVQELSVNISSLYQSIPYSQKVTARSIYDSYDKKIKWVYDTDLVNGGFKELIFDLKLSAFYKAEYGGLQTAARPILLGPVEIPPFSTYKAAETAYLVWDTNANRLSFATVNDDSFKDWVDYDGTGVDSEAYLVTGYIGTGDFARYKQVPYITFHFNRTESGFLDDGNDLKVIGESSCIVQSQWDWTNTAASNKWGKPFQAYRYKRPYMPSGAGDSYDTGRETIVTKNKLRGRGRVLSLKISSEPEKDLQLLGWSMIIGANGNV